MSRGGLIDIGLADAMARGAGLGLDAARLRQGAREAELRRQEDARQFDAANQVHQGNLDLRGREMDFQQERYDTGRFDQQEEMQADAALSGQMAAGTLSPDTTGFHRFLAQSSPTLRGAYLKAAMENKAGAGMEKKRAALLQHAEQTADKRKPHQQQAYVAAILRQTEPEGFQNVEARQQQRDFILQGLLSNGADPQVAETLADIHAYLEPNQVGEAAREVESRHKEYQAVKAAEAKVAAIQAQRQADVEGITRDLNIRNPRTSPESNEATARLRAGYDQSIPVGVDGDTGEAKTQSITKSNEYEALRLDLADAEDELRSVEQEHANAKADPDAQMALRPALKDARGRVKGARDQMRLLLRVQRTQAGGQTDIPDDILDQAVRELPDGTTEQIEARARELMQKPR